VPGSYAVYRYSKVYGVLIIDDSVRSMYPFWFYLILFLILNYFVVVFSKKVRYLKAGFKAKCHSF